MPVCPGKKLQPPHSKCISNVYRCKKCGNAGCTTLPECSNQGFKSGKCVKCGTVGQSELLK